MEIQVKLSKLHDKQKEVSLSKALIKVVCAGRQSGKSYVAKDMTFNRMLDGKKCGYLTPEFSLSKNFFRDFEQLIPKELIKSTNKSELRIELITGGTLQFYSSNSVDNIRGNSFDFWVIDEAVIQESLEYNLVEVVLPTTLTRKTDVLIISTPNGFDYFYSLYQKGLNKEPGYESFNYNLYDSPYMTKEQIEFLRSTCTESQWNQEYLAIPSEGSSPFGSNHSKCIQKELSTKKPVVIGLDIAFSQDYTVAIGLDEDGKTCLFERMKGDPVVVMAKLSKLPNNVPIYIDATGAGKIVYSVLVQTHNVFPFVYNAQSKQRLMFNLQLGVESGECSYPEIVSKEMSTMESNITKTGITQFYNKHGYHDDTVQAYALAYFHFPQYKPTSNAGRFQAVSIRR